MNVNSEPIICGPDGKGFFIEKGADGEFMSEDQCLALGVPIGSKWGTEYTGNVAIGRFPVVQTSTVTSTQGELFEIRRTVEGLGDAATCNVKTTTGTIESGDLKESTRVKVIAGMKRRSLQNIREVFDRYKSEGTEMIEKGSLPDALRLLKVNLVEESLDELLVQVDASEAKLDFDRFLHVVSHPSTLERALEKIPLTSLIADAIPERDGMDPLDVFVTLNPDEIASMVAGMQDGLSSLIYEHVISLRESISAMERLKSAANPGASKFSVPTMSAGNVFDFHEGLFGRVGACNLNFEKAMCMEHCSNAGSEFVFTTANYGISTTPRNEWEIVVNRGLDKADMRHGRRITDISELLESATARTAQLQRSEVVAVVLYTGPMFMVYNAMLRQWPADIFETFSKGGNKFATTIHVLVSAVQKIARSMPLPDNTRLYRGLGGTMELPSGFFKADKQGCRGFTEWGFMSTTSQRAVALEYSGVRQGRVHASVLVLQVGAVDRGACIRDFSQYPQEVEYLWLPCSFIAPLGEPWMEATAEGFVRMIPIRVNANLKATTIEQMLDRKKQMHISAFSYLIEELAFDLAETARGPAALERWERDPRKTAQASSKPRPADLVHSVVQSLWDLLHSQEQMEAGCFADDDEYWQLNRGMAESLLFGRSKFEYWMQNCSEMIESVIEYKPRLAHRLYIGFLTKRVPSLTGNERQLEALRLARLRRMLANSVLEINELGEDKLVQAAAEGASFSQLQLLVWAGNDGCLSESSALYTAAQGGHSETVRALVALGAQVNKAMPNGVGPLWIASLNGHEQCVEALAELGADLNMPKNNQCTPLYVAAEYGHTGTVELLARLGADVDRRERAGMTPAFIAALNGHASTLVALNVAGADLDLAKPNGCTPLYVAAEYGHTHCVRTLLELGANPARANVNGMTDESIARKNGHDECVALLAGLT